jgi:hypothetical protein
MRKINRCDNKRGKKSRLQEVRRINARKAQEMFFVFLYIRRFFPGTILSESSADDDQTEMVILRKEPFIRKRMSARKKPDSRRLDGHPPAPPLCRTSVCSIHFRVLSIPFGSTKWMPSFPQLLLFYKKKIFVATQKSMAFIFLKSAQ